MRLNSIFKVVSSIRHLIAGVLFAASVALTLEVSAAEYRFTEAELAQIVGAEAVVSEIQKIERARRANDANQLLGILAQLEQAPVGQAPSFGPAAEAYLRYEALKAFASMPEMASARATLQRNLGSWEPSAPRISVWREDDGHRSLVVAFDPTAAARFALGSWNQRAWYTQARADLGSGKTEFVGAWIQAQHEAGGRLAATGLVNALADSSPAELMVLLPGLRTRLAAGEPVADLARVVASRLTDESLAQSVIEHANSANALAFLAETRGFSEASQLRLMTLASERSDLGSAAMYRMAAVGSPASKTALLSRLGSQELGSSAAAALARYPDEGLLQDLAAIVTDHGDPLTRRRAVLSLHLMPGGAGRELLSQLSRSSQIDPDLRSLITSKLP